MSNEFYKNKETSKITLDCFMFNKKNSFKNILCTSSA